MRAHDGNGESYTIPEDEEGRSQILNEIQQVLDAYESASKVGVVERNIAMAILDNIPVLRQFEMGTVKYEEAQKLKKDLEYIARHHGQP